MAVHQGTQDPRRAATPLEVRFAQSPLSRHRRQLIRSILDNPKEAYFLSSRELARRYDVDAATVVRTVQALGYERFADFAADLREHFVRQITPYTVLKAASEEKRSVAGHVVNGFDRDSENLSVLKATLDPDRVVALAEQIHRARRIVVVGVDLAASLSWFLAYGLVTLGFEAEAPVGSAGNLQHKIDLLTDKDLLVAISFGRCLRDTMHAVLRARERGVPTFGITDGNTTPIAMHCGGYLLAPISSPSFTGSYVAPLALVNAITLACTHLQPKRALAILRRTEEDYKSGERWYQEPRRAELPRSNNGKRLVPPKPQGGAGGRNGANGRPLGSSKNLSKG